MGCGLLSSGTRRTWRWRVKGAEGGFEPSQDDKAASWGMSDAWRVVDDRLRRWRLGEVAEEVGEFSIASLGTRPRGRRGACRWAGALSCRTVGNTYLHKIVVRSYYVSSLLRMVTAASVRGRVAPGVCPQRRWSKRPVASVKRTCSSACPGKQRVGLADDWSVALPEMRCRYHHGNRLHGHNCSGMTETVRAIMGAYLGSLPPSSRSPVGRLPWASAVPRWPVCHVMLRRV
jgi:hypothetical protein